MAPSSESKNNTCVFTNINYLSVCSSKLNKVDYHELGEAGIVINLIGVCLICLAILMPYIIRNLDIKHPMRSKLDRHLKLSQLEMRI